MIKTLLLWVFCPDKAALFVQESDIILLLRSVFDFIGKATGLREAKDWIEREKRGRLGKTEGLGNTTTARINYNNNNSNNDSHFNYNTLWQQPKH